MAFGLISYEKRMKENIKNYDLNQLYNIQEITDFIKLLAKYAKISILLTNRHGDKMISSGKLLADFKPDVVSEPGIKIKIAERTMAHLYMVEDEQTDSELASKVMKSLEEQLVCLGALAYEKMELSLYAGELENKLEKEQFQVRQGDKLDPLTKVFNNTYFCNRMKVIDRSDVVPVSVIQININDWKYANDNFGDEESDRLIRVVASFVKEYSKPEYIIGRSGGDNFTILIPLAEEGEAEEYCVQVQDACINYVDEILAPSVAYGFVMKTNVEEKIEDLLSDAEYEMFQNKLEMKQADGYMERLCGKHK